MGREAQCLCQIGTSKVMSKVLLEATEIIIRGELRRRIPIPDIRDLAVDGSALVFRAGSDRVILDLGRTTAQRWLAAMQKPPATLSRKLGLKPETRVSVWGDFDCAELSEAIAASKPALQEQFDVAIACVHSVSQLHSALRANSPLSLGKALWIVYPKGQSEGVGETTVLHAARGVGLRDTKVVSVSSSLTALRFSAAP